MENTQGERVLTIADIEAKAARQGIVFTDEDRAEAYRLVAERRDQLLNEQSASNAHRTRFTSAIEAFNNVFPKLLTAMVAFGDMSIAFLHTLIVGPGVLLILALLLLVELGRVSAGVRLFESDTALADFSAAALVLLNVALDVLIGWLEHRSNYTEPRALAASLRLFLRRVAYWIGFAPNWTPVPKSPAQRFKVVLRLVTVSLLVLALAGSMQSVIARQGNTDWLDALINVATKSTLLDLSVWVGGLLFAASSVMAAQAISSFAARKAVELAELVKSTPADKRMSAVLEAAGASGAVFLMARLNDYSRQRRAAASAAETASQHEYSVPVSLFDGVSNSVSNGPNTEGVFQSVSSNVSNGVSNTPYNSEVFQGVSPNVSNSVSNTSNTEGVFQGVSNSVSNVSDAAKQPPKVQEAIEWLTAEPGRMDLSIRNASTASGLSQSAIHRAKLFLKGE